MDPNATLEMIETALNAKDYREASSLREVLRNWLRNRGFEPRWTAHLRAARYCRALWLEVNGDPYGGGFEASEETCFGLVHRGDIGARPRSFWRVYARRNGYQLRTAS